jgi:hypothetical protein
MHTFLTQVDCESKTTWSGVPDARTRVFRPLLVGPILVLQMAAVGFGSVLFDA